MPLSTASQNIRYLRKKYQFTQADMAQKLGIKRSLLGAYEEARANPRLDVLVKAAEIFNVSVDQLVSRLLNESAVPKQPTNGLPTVNEISTQSDLSQSGKYRKRKIAENFSKSSTPSLESVQRLRLVPKSEYKHYFFNAVDDDYIRSLPEIQLPLLPSTNSQYRAFEVTDDSMQPVLEGSVVVGFQLDSIQQAQDGKTYVLITRTEGVLFRRVYNHIARSGQLLLEATHPDYAQQQLSVMGREVEAWEVVLYLSPEMPTPETPSSSHEMDMPQLTRLVLDLQQEVLRLKEEVGHQTP